MPLMQSEAIEAMTRWFRQLERALAPPGPIATQNSFVFRYQTRGIHEALLQKLARSISGLNAVAVLLNAGYVQEIGVIFRTLDEIHEDIFFLASAETNGSRTARHDKYLAAFYADAVMSRPEGSIDIPKPNLLPRKKVRAQTLSALGQGINVSRALAVSESLSTAYSGYVHAASENIMEMYGGNPPKFHLSGMLGTPRIDSFSRASEQYVNRGLMATGAVAKAFGDRELVDTLYTFFWLIMNNLMVTSTTKVGPNNSFKPKPLRGSA